MPIIPYIVNQTTNDCINSDLPDGFISVKSAIRRDKNGNERNAKGNISKQAG